MKKQCQWLSFLWVCVFVWVCACVCLAPLGARSRALNYTYVLIPLPVATTKGFPAFPLPKWRDAHTLFLTSSRAHTHTHKLKQNCELELFTHAVTPNGDNPEEKLQEMVFILIDLSASVTKHLPVRILHRQAKSGWRVWMINALSSLNNCQWDAIEKGI